eukprot:UN25060
MWPHDLTQKDYIDIQSHIPKNSTIWYPWTKVTRTHKIELLYPIKDDDGNEQEWFVHTSDKTYRVVNMVYDRMFRRDILDIADILKDVRNHLDSDNEQKYVELFHFFDQTALHMTNGNFMDVLEIDLQQNFERIFFSFNYCGYLPNTNNIDKSLVQFTLGTIERRIFLRDVVVLTDMIQQSNSLFENINFMDSTNIILLWPVRTAGVLRVIENEPISFIYPAKSHKTLGQRSVILMDTLEILKTKIGESSNMLKSTEEQTESGVVHVDIVSGLEMFIILNELVKLTIYGNDNYERYSESLVHALSLKLCQHIESENVSDILGPVSTKKDCIYR